ncbi:MAG TPA: hypothetical protein PLQ97_07145 [Myxococcota bacterium]|nr:hypothetical protein [Myxococcota bacterium]HQK50410.1 hypothetical protein [Myxococcota bacterium]
MGRNDLLFYRGDLRAEMENRVHQMFAEIDRLDTDYVLLTAQDALCDFFEEKYRLPPPVLLEDQIRVEQREAQVDVSHDPRRAIFDRSEPFFIAGTEVIYHVPFEGDGKVFGLQPSSFTLNPPRGQVHGNELLLRFSRTDHDPTVIKSDFDQQLRYVKDYLRSATADLKPFNEGIRAQAAGRLATRRSKLLADRQLVEALGFPLVKRTDPPAVAVGIKKKITLPKPTTASGTRGFRPEPAIDGAVYDDILGVCRNMALSMERSPSTFWSLDEEQIRDMFLVSLNGVFEGKATGETFNKTGKTDILIREGNRNLFIAECKFWHGAKGLSDTIDQILGYAQWRDCKLAILLFNKNKDFSSVLVKVAEGLRGHRLYRRSRDYGDQTCFRCQFQHPDDAQREVTLTLLAFEVPQPPVGATA